MSILVEWSKLKHINKCKNGIISIEFGYDTSQFYHWKFEQLQTNV